MKLEAVGGVAVGDLTLQVGRQVDDMNSAEWAFLRADTATNTEALRDESDLGLGSNLNAKLSGTDDGAGLFTFLTTFLDGKKESVTRP